MTSESWINRAAFALCITCSACDGAEDTKEQAAASSAKGTKSKAAVSKQADPPAAAKAATPEPAAAKKAVPKAAEPDKSVVVLEMVELEGLGKIKLPKGYEEFHKNGWKYDLGDYKSITVSWEPHGAKSLKKAEKMSKILANAPTVRTSKTLESGYHEIERVRDSDGFTFVAVFSDKWYVKCVAPESAMEHCREIVRSKA